jgi:hypothetical protein
VLIGYVDSNGKEHTATIPAGAAASFNYLAGRIAANRGATPAANQQQFELFCAEAYWMMMHAGGEFDPAAINWTAIRGGEGISRRAPPSEE